LIDKFRGDQKPSLISLETNPKEAKFLSTIEFENVSFTYPGSETKASAEISFGVSSGSSLAIVGPSGSGKSTVLDLLLGVINPDEGRVLVSGVPPRDAIKIWPGSVGFVPQDIVIIKGSIRENVALGYPIEEASDDRVYKALGIANLLQFVESLPQGIDTELTERGANLSGGQRQRLGIARALFTDPKLLVLDEATSSLDAETEEEVTKSILELHGAITIVIVAHRLSTVRSSDKVAYLLNGNVTAIGTFDEVRKAVPEFNYQVEAMGR
jgi:ABC-type multidrug transport system fused ATPase/permease subunit